MTKKAFQLLITFWLSLLCQQVFAVKDYIVERSYFEDVTTQMSFEEARHKEYQPIGNMLSKGYSDSAFWVRLKIDSASQSNHSLSDKLSDKLILRIQPAYLDDIRVFDPLEPTDKLRVSGDHYTAIGSEYLSLNFNFVIPRSSDARYIWLRLRTDSTSLMHVQALDPEDCSHLDRIQEFGFAFYLAILFLLFIFPLIIWFYKQDFLVGVFVFKQFAAMSVLVFNAGYLRLMFKTVDVETLQALVNLNLLVYSLITIFFHFIFLNEYVMRRWAKVIFIGVMCALPIEVGLLFAKMDRQALNLNMFCLNLIVLSFLVIPIFGIDWQKTKNPIFSKGKLIFIHLMIFVTAILTTMPSLGYFQGSQLSPVSGLAYGGITGIIFFMILQYRYRLSREQSIAEISRAEASAQSEKEHREQQGKFLAMLTHELKTPLSIMKMGHTSAHPSETVRKHVQTAIQDMTDVIDRCVMDDQLQNQKFTLNLVSCNLNDLILEKFQQYDDQSRLQLFSNQIYTIRSDLQLLRVCFNNLIDNAWKYGDEHSPIVIELSDSVDSAHVMISISNKVGKIGAPDVSKVFDKYYRAPKAHEKTGSGLGLYLVKNFIELMGGDITCCLSGDNIVFAIYFPK